MTLTQDWDTPSAVDLPGFPAANSGEDQPVGVLCDSGAGRR